MMHLTEDAKQAVQQLANGATVGMVDMALQKKGIGSGPRGEIIKYAKRIVNRRDRLKHLSIGVAGLLVLTLGAYWFYALKVNQDNRVKGAVAMMGTGLLLAIYGVYNFRQRRF